MRTAACPTPRRFCPPRPEPDSALYRPGLGPAPQRRGAWKGPRCPDQAKKNRAAARHTSTLCHNTAADPAKTPHTARCIGDGTPIPPNSKSPQNAIKTPLRAKAKNNRPGAIPGRPVPLKIIGIDTAGCSIACCNSRGAAHTVDPCGCLRQSVPAARRCLSGG